jgi:dihydrofolate reductase
MEMGKLVVTEFVSADGVFQDPGGIGEISRGGWSFKAEHGEEFDRFKTDELMAADVQLLGRTTYEGFAQAWPEMEESEGEFPVKMNSMPKYVVSTTLSDEDATWNNSTVISDDVPGAVAKAQGRGRWRHPDRRQRTARPDATRRGAGRRAAADDLPDHRRRGKAPVRPATRKCASSG